MSDVRNEKRNLNAAYKQESFETNGKRNKDWQVSTFVFRYVP